MMTNRRDLIGRVFASKGLDLDEYVAGLRSQGLGWRVVAERLAEDHDVHIGHVTLLRWYADEPAAKAG